MGLSEENLNANQFVLIEAKSIFERNLIFSKNEKTEKTETQISFEANFRLGFESFHEFRGFLKKKSENSNESKKSVKNNLFVKILTQPMQPESDAALIQK